MTKLAKIIEEVIAEIIPTSEEREAIAIIIKLQEEIGGHKSTNQPIMDKYEKIIEGLIK
ncbi:hypothetical protein KAT80_02750 [Candidatus Pacearchaeota archaeon]|nr:hypothetical protein [Candidatus Pacearchaeota archaeon]